MNPMDDVEMNAGGFDAANDAGAKGSADKKAFKNKTIQSVSIKQILKASREQGMVSIDNQTPEMVRLFAIIESDEHMSTSIEYRLNDGTGSIQAKKWKEKDAAEVQAGQCVTGSMVQVVGTLKEFNNVLSMQIFGMAPVSDWNALTHHLLDVILTHNINTKGPVPGSESAKSRQSAAYNMGMGGTAAMVSPGMGGRIKTESALDDKLLKAIKQTSKPDIGTTVDMTFDYLTRTLGEKVTRDIVDRMVQALMNDGVLYTTIDEMHFQSCED